MEKRGGREEEGGRLDEEDLVQVLGFLVTGALNSYFCFQVEMSSEWDGLGGGEGSNPQKFIYSSDLLTQYQHNIHIATEWISNEGLFVNIVC